jgi:hypothetical protein
VFVLPVHEVENFFLHPMTLDLLLQQNGRAELAAATLIREAADAHAGSWIFQHAMATQISRSLPDISTAAKERGKALTWERVSADQNAAMESVASAAGYGDVDQRRLRGVLDICARSYARRRGEDSLWKVCEGKQVLNDVARATGFAGAPALTQATFVAWARDEARLPEELAAFREYLTRL